jgi:hypothetical protein
MMPGYPPAVMHGGWARGYGSPPHDRTAPRPRAPPARERRALAMHPDTKKDLTPALTLSAGTKPFIPASAPTAARPVSVAAAPSATAAPTEKPATSEALLGDEWQRKWREQMKAKGVAIAEGRQVGIRGVDSGV